MGAERSGAVRPRLSPFSSPRGGAASRALPGQVRGEGQVTARLPPPLSSPPRAGGNRQPGSRGQLLFAGVFNRRVSGAVRLAGWWGRKESLLLGEAVCTSRRAPPGCDRRHLRAAAKRSRVSRCVCCVAAWRTGEVRSSLAPNSPSAASASSSVKRWFGVRCWLLGSGWSSAPQRFCQSSACLWLHDSTWPEWERKDGWMAQHSEIHSVVCAAMCVSVPMLHVYLLATQYLLQHVYLYQ